MTAKRLDNVVEVVQSETYRVIGTITLAELLRGYYDRKEYTTEYVYDPHDKEISRAADVAHWAQYSRKFGQRKVLLLAYPEPTTTLNRTVK